LLATFECPHDDIDLLEHFTRVNKLAVPLTLQEVMI
jgi:hypothetical protein